MAANLQKVDLRSTGFKDASDDDEGISTAEPHTMGDDLDIDIEHDAPQHRRNTVQGEMDIEIDDGDVEFVDDGAAPAPRKCLRAARAWGAAWRGRGPGRAVEVSAPFGAGAPRRRRVGCR